ncbi:MAG: NRDE family protein [Cyclobacteriaceae bacterium]
MCLILFSWKFHPKYKLVLAANRDEFYARPTAKADYWIENKNMIAGTDLQAGGTWIGITKTGRLAAITNYRDPKNLDANATSRGKLTTDFLNSLEKPEDYLERVQVEGNHFNGYNLLVGDSEDLFYFNNVNNEIKKVESGVFGLSNGFFQENWPKLEKGRNALQKIVNKETIEREDLFTILSDNQIAPDDELPKTGIPFEWERALSPLFIKTEEYGTRCSTLIFMDYQNGGTFEEKTYQVDGWQQESHVVLNF